MKYFTIFMLSLITILPTVKSGEVAKACSQAKFPIIELGFRKGKENFSKILSSDLGKAPFASYLKQFYQTVKIPQDEAHMVKFVFEGNSKFISDSELKTKFLSYATTSERINNPAGYRALLIDLIRRFFPDEKKSLDWFIALKDPTLNSTSFRPAKNTETGDVYGAVNLCHEDTPGKFNYEIVVSNNESEPIPYLIPLIQHELHHASSYPMKIKSFYNDVVLSEELIVEEAKAFDIQMHAYLKLAQLYPELFCDWLYVTWSYGEIPVPLSWTMASMEKEMLAGSFIYNYAKMGTYKEKVFLLNSTGTDLRPDLKERIKKMNLKFLK